MPGNYRPDTTNLTALTRAQLFAKIQNGDKLTIMGVPPLSGTRMGKDRNEDGVLDGDRPVPSLQIAQVAASAVINRPYSAAGFELETAENLLPGAWTNVGEPIEILGGLNYVTNQISGEARSYRLRFPSP